MHIIYCVYQCMQQLHDFCVCVDCTGVHAVCDSSGWPLAGRARANVLQCQGVKQIKTGN